MEFGCCDNFGEFFHVRGFDINDVEALILYVQVPQIDPEIIAADKSLAVTVDRDAINVIRMCVRISTAGNSRNNGVVVCKPRQLQVSSISELLC